MTACAADQCRANQWVAGTDLLGEEDGWLTVIRITAVGVTYILARTLAERPSGQSWRVSSRGESLWNLSDRSWRVMADAEFAPIVAQIEGFER
jgi:hypothetical protein